IDQDQDRVRGPPAHERDLKGARVSAPNLLRRSGTRPHLRVAILELLRTQSDTAFARLGRYMLSLKR
ncbi:MAG: hypothetical protein ACOVQM_00275, partial [Pirellula sp.]